MNRTQLLAITAALYASVGAEAVAQGAKMTARPDSKVTVSGSSNVHHWACQSTGFQATVELDSNYATLSLTEVKKPIGKVVVNVPVRTLKCGNGKMDANMYKALRADEFTEIRYVLDTYKMDVDKTAADGFAALTTGDLTVAGKTVKVEIPITALRGLGGTMTGEGTLRMRMTDFGIKPPVALLGTLRTKNEIELKFEILLDRAVVVALTQQP